MAYSSSFWGRVQRSAPVWLALTGACGGVQALEPVISMGDGHALLLRADNTVWSWGSNTAGQLGLGGGSVRTVPTRIAGLDNVVSVVARGTFSMALKADGTVWTWGASGDGRVDPGVSSTVPLKVQGLSGIVRIAAGHTNAPAFAVDASGRVYGWGSNSAGQLGAGTAAPGRNALPQLVSQANGVVAVSASNASVLALRSDGSVLGWGSNELGALLPAGTTSPIPATVIPGLSGVRAVAATSINTPGQHYALLADGSVTVWGQSNTSATFCGRDLAPAPVMTGLRAIDGLTGITHIEGGDGHTLFVGTQGALFACGVNSSGQLGDGTFTDPSKTAPKIARVLNLPAVVSAAAGAGHSGAIGEDGSTWVWGRVREGLAGVGMPDTLASAIRVKAADGSDFNAGQRVGASPVFAGTQSGSLDRVTVDVGLAVAPEHRGQPGRLYLLALLGTQAVMLNGQGQWVPLDPQSPAPFLQGPLPAQAPLNLLRDVDARALAGATVVLGYGVGVGAAADTEMLAQARYRVVLQLQ